MKVIDESVKSVAILIVTARMKHVTLISIIKLDFVDVKMVI